MPQSKKFTKGKKKARNVYTRRKRQQNNKPENIAWNYECIHIKVFVNSWVIRDTAPRGGDHSTELKADGISQCDLLFSDFRVEGKTVVSRRHMWLIW